jgi:hypothetical protein
MTRIKPDPQARQRRRELALAAARTGFAVTMSVETPFYQDGVRRGELPNYTAMIRADGEEFVLTWDDGQVEYCERYELLSVALARLAVLQRCCEDDWHSSFEHSPDEFWPQAYGFLSDEVTEF